LWVLCGGFGCATLDGADHAVYDRAEAANRVSYRVSDAVDRGVLRPVARGYRRVSPDFVERGISNFFQNLRTLPSSINGFLQGKLRGGATDLGRVVVNSTLGLAGFLDVASGMGLAYQNEDLGQTLAVWGWRKTRYVYIPFLGPSTVRDVPSTLISSFMPRLLVGSDYHWGVSVLDLISARAAVLSATDVRDASALDPYAFTRDAFMQRRKFLIYDGDLPLDDAFDEFEAFEDEF